MDLAAESGEGRNDDESADFPKSSVKDGALSFLLMKTCRVPVLFTHENLSSSRNLRQAVLQHHASAAGDPAAMLCDLEAKEGARRTCPVSFGYVKATRTLGSR